MNEILNQRQVPAVSVIMPAYNMERFIAQAIRSVMAQTMTDWELLVIDDGSSDNTCAIVRELARQDDRIRLCRNEANMGVAKTRNRGFEMSRGEYVALLDSDDLWLPENLEKQLALARSTGAELVYCSYGIVDEQGCRICDDFIVPETTDLDSMLVKSVISCSTALLERKIVERYRFRDAFYHEDLVLWLELLRDGYTARGQTEVLAQYRVMAGSRAYNKLRSAVRRWKVYRDFLGLSLGKSAGCLLEYTLLGLKKYRKCPNDKTR